MERVAVSICSCRCVCVWCESGEAGCWDGAVAGPADDVGWEQGDGDHDSCSGDRMKGAGYG